MASVITVIVVVIMSLLVVRVATVALVLTGLSKDLARFQARSAFTGAGFTTTESEQVMRHPVRRRIIMLLMLLGNAGLVTAATSLIISFTNLDQEKGGLTSSIWFRLLVLAGAITLLWLAAYSKWLDRQLTRLIALALARWTNLEVRDYAALFHLTGDYAVIELQVQPGDWLADKNLAKLNLNEEGVLVLGIERQDGDYVGAPRGKTSIRPYDTLLLYGRQKVLDDLDERRGGPEGNRKHFESVVEQMKVERELESSDEEASDDEDATPASNGEATGAERDSDSARQP